MTKYISFEPKAEVIGHSVLAFISNTEAANIRPVLEQHNLVSIDPERWYELQEWLNVLSDLSARGGGMFNMVAIGAAISETTILPPEVEKMPFEQFLFLVDQVYQMQHRNGNVGSVQVEKVADKHMRLTLRVPYPDDLEFGTAYGFARRFLPPGTELMVQYNSTAPRREQGGDCTVIDITWK